MSNCKHPLGSRPGGGRLQGSIQAGAYVGGQGCTGGVPTHLPPLLSSQGSVLGPEGIKGGFTSDAGVGDLAQLGLPVQQEGLQPDTRKNFLDWEKRWRNSSLHPPTPDLHAKVPSLLSEGAVVELACLPRKLGSGVGGPRVKAWVGEGD